MHDTGRRVWLILWISAFVVFGSQQTTISNSRSESSTLTLRYHSENSSAEVPKGGHKGIDLASLRYEYVAVPLHITLFVIIAGFVKIFFHQVPHLSSFIPESCILILIGTIMGAILCYGLKVPDTFRLDSRTFMLFLLPPIVLEASYSLNDRTFSDNLWTILIYAILGTVANFLFIGFSMYGLGVAGVLFATNMRLTMLQILLFASFIVAVDPVAVLAIFQDIRVNKRLYFLVSGESLFNDAVTIVLYNMMTSFIETRNTAPIDVFIGVVSFFVTTLCSLAIGLLFGIISSLSTRLTTRVRVFEPLIILMLAYLSFICAELFHWSGIISIIVCGLVQAQYALCNISRKSNITVHYFIKMLSSVTDSIIFLFLGLELLRTRFKWDTGFVLWALCLCLLARIIMPMKIPPVLRLHQHFFQQIRTGTVNARSYAQVANIGSLDTGILVTGVCGLTFFINWGTKSQKIKPEEQFIMWYGGLRGAMCFALCSTVSASEENQEVRNLFLTATFFLIMFTVFGQGITIKPLVKWCRIIRDVDRDKELLIELDNLVINNIITGFEAILGETESSGCITRIYQLNDKYLKRWLQKRPENDVDQFLNIYKHIALKYYYAAMSGMAPVPLKLPLNDCLSLSMVDASVIELDVNKEMKTNVEEIQHQESFKSQDFQLPSPALQGNTVITPNQTSSRQLAAAQGRPVTRCSWVDPALMSENDVTKMHKILSKASIANTIAFPHDRDLVYHDVEEFINFDHQLQDDLTKSMLNWNAGSRHVSVDSYGAPFSFKASSRQHSLFHQTVTVEDWLTKRKSSVENSSEYVQFPHLDQTKDVDLTAESSLVEPDEQESLTGALSSGIKPAIASTRAEPAQEFSHSPCSWPPATRSSTWITQNAGSDRLSPLSEEPGDEKYLLNYSSSSSLNGDSPEKETGQGFENPAVSLEDEVHLAGEEQHSVNPVTYWKRT